MKMAYNPFFVGGDSQEFEYDFGLKVANSVAECPMKIYTASVNPASLPSPTDPIWREIRQQRLLDRLKSQNNTGLVETATNKVTDYVVHHKAPIDGLLGAEIEGRTIKNEVPYNPTTWAEWNKTAGSVVGDSTGLTFTANGTNTCDAVILMNSINKNTKYGLLYNVISSNIPNNTLVLASSSGNYPLSGPIPSIVGNQKTSLTSNSTFTQNKFDIYVNSSASAGQQIKLKDVRVFELPTGSEIEADFTNLTADQLAAKYPFGGSSALLNLKPTNVKSVGKNLFDKSVISPNYAGNTTTSVLSTGVKVKNSIAGAYRYVAYKLQLKSKSLYTIGFTKTTVLGTDSNSVLRVLSDDFNTQLGVSSASSAVISVTTPASGIIYIVLYSAYLISELGEVDFTNIQLEEGSTATTYEAYKETSIDLTAEALDLKRLSNSIADDTNLQTGELTKKVGSVVLNGSENWGIIQDWGNGYVYASSPTYDAVVNSNNGAILSDKFPTSNAFDASIPKTSELICTTYTSHKIRLSILKSKLSTVDTPGIKAYFAANPTTVYYELATPVTTKLTADTTTLPSYQNGSLIVDANMPPVLNEWHTTDVNDNGVMVYGSSTSGLAIANMIEVDLTAVCNTFYGGSNSAMKSGLKSILADIWTQASGANGGMQTNGVVCKWYNNSISSWGDTGGGTNSTGSISKVVMSTIDNVRINSSNKIHIIITSQYASDNITSSTLQLDYANVKVAFSRVPDTISPISVNLPKNWAMVIKGFSPCWSSTDSSMINHSVFELGRDYNNCILLIKSTNAKRWIFRKRINGAMYDTLVDFPVDFSKYQIQSMIVGNSSSGMFFYIILNNGSVVKSTNSNADTISGTMMLYLMCSTIFSSYKADAFLESLHLIDLDKIRPLVLGSELVTNGDFALAATSWTPISGTWDFTNGRSSMVPSAANQYAQQQYIAATPNTKYRIKCDFLGTGKHWLWIYFHDSNSSIISGTGYFSTDNLPDGLIVTSPANTVKIRMAIGNSDTTGTYIFDNISLKQVLQDGFTDAEAATMLKGINHIKEANLVVNGDFSNGTSGWVGVNSTNTVANNTLTNTGNGASIAPYVNQQSLGDWQLNKKIYFRSKARVTNPNCSLLTLRTWASGSGTQNASQQSNPIANQWYTLSGIVTLASGGSGKYNVELAHQYTDSATASGKVMEVQEMMVIDLTSLFGAGNEPTVAQFEALLAQTSTNPIDVTNPELFDISKVTLHANATRSGDTITLNATADNQNSIFSIPIFPNNKYEIKCKHNAYAVIVREYYNNILLKSTTMLRSVYSDVITTGSIANKMELLFVNGIAGTFTFSNISLKRKD